MLASWRISAVVRSLAAWRDCRAGEDGWAKFLAKDPSIGWVCRRSGGSAELPEFGGEDAGEAMMVGDPGEAGVG